VAAAAAELIDRAVPPVMARRFRLHVLFILIFTVVFVTNAMVVTDRSWPRSHSRPDHPDDEPNQLRRRAAAGSHPGPHSEKVTALRQSGHTAMLCLLHLVVTQVPDVRVRDRFSSAKTRGLDLFGEREGSVRPPPMSGRRTTVPSPRRGPSALSTPFNTLVFTSAI